jgi:hypothetical protein
MSAKNFTNLGDRSSGYVVNGYPPMAICGMIEALTFTRRTLYPPNALPSCDAPRWASVLTGLLPTLALCLYHPEGDYMFARFAFATLVALAFQPTLSGPASAGGCRDNAECYEKVKAPDVYATVARPVVVQPGYQQTVHTPAVVGARTQKIEVQPGAWSAHHKPAEYGSYTKSVMVQPARVSHTHVPARYATVHETVVVRAAGYRWERSVDRHGRETMCKVAVPAETRTVARQVQVSAAQTVAHTTPAVYKTVTQPVLLSPAKTVHAYTPPVHDYVSHPVVLRPAQTHVVNHPPVMGVAHSQVLVREGGSRWQPVSNRHW